MKLLIFWSKANVTHKCSLNHIWIFIYSLCILHPLCISFFRPMIPTRILLEQNKSQINYSMWSLFCGRICSCLTNWKLNWLVNLFQESAIMQLTGYIEFQCVFCLTFCLRFVSLIYPLSQNKSSLWHSQPCLVMKGLWYFLYTGSCGNFIYISRIIELLTSVGMLKVVDI